MTHKLLMSKAVAAGGLFSDDFTAANGSAINAAKWDNKASAGVGTTEEIQSNQWRISTSAGGYTAYARAGCIMAVTADVDIELVVTPSVITECFFAAVARNGSWSAAKPSSGYMFRMNFAGGSGLRVEILRNSTSLVLGNPSTVTYTAGTAYKLRAQCTGTTLRMKVWADGSGEPGAWDVSTTDATYASGVCGLSFENGNVAASRVVDINYITIV